jgi:hypothetical protein
MAQPLPKSPELSRFLEKLFESSTAVQTHVCAICRLPAVDFRDEDSQAEFQQSGLCQPCQDIVFQPGAPAPLAPEDPRDSETVRNADANTPWRRVAHVRP